jgi:hypothetical protein
MVVPSVVFRLAKRGHGYERLSNKAKLTYIILNSQTPPMRAGAGLSRLTKGVAGGFITRNARIIPPRGMMLRPSQPSERKA